MNRFPWLFTALLLVAVSSSALADPGRITVQVDKPTHPISPTFYGLMTEEINHSYDGGLYAELIQNRAFKDNANEPTHWSMVQDAGGAGTITLDKAQHLNDALPVSLRLSVTAAQSGKRVGVANDGYWGIPVMPNTTYDASFYAKTGDNFSGPLNVDIESGDGGTTYAHARVSSIGTTWRQYHVTLKTGDVRASVANRFVISATHPGTVWLDLISLFPPTYNHRKNGDRIDLTQKLIGMHPSFLRLPGGNYLEGNTIAERFPWKQTLGGLAQRPGHQGPWGYRSSDGMGLLEYVHWCEDMHAQPVLAVYAGYSLGGDYVKPGPDLVPYVQDALDEIQYLTGDASTTWGARRIADGHPLPVSLTYVEIGNEDGFDKSQSYDGRYAQFYDAIKAAYPKLQLIATAHVKSRTPDVLDDHYYRSAADMERDAAHYDATDRSGPKIFVGEWASTEGAPTPTMQAALGDAAWLTGLERNSDVVVMEAYAPLLVNVNPNGSQWGTNLIGYDGLSSFGSPSYYVQSMFGANTGDVELPTTITLPPAPPVTPPQPRGKVGVGTWSTQAEFRDILVTNRATTLYQKDFASGASDWTALTGQWQTQDGVLRQSSPETNCRDFAGDANWTDYTYSLKARKLGGVEGFLIAFHVKDAQNYFWWNIGGWGNSRTAVQRVANGSADEISASAPVTVETGRWYDIKIEVSGRDIKCYLDGTLVSQATDTPPPPPTSLFAASSRDTKTGDVYVKVINVSDRPQSITVDLQGATGVANTAVAEVLTGEPTAVNTLSAPEAIAPHSQTLTIRGSSFLHEFPPHSVTVLHFKTK